MAQMITPFHALNDLHRELSRVFDERPLLRSDNGNGNSWTPHVDIKDTDTGYEVIVDVPGVAPEEVDVTVHNNVLSIRGERSDSRDEDRENFRRRERFYGSFLRQFTLPDSVDESAVEANVKHGVLTVNIPRAAEIQPRNIEVQGE